MKYAILLLISIFFTSCNDKDSDTITDYSVKNEADIVKYIADNKLDAKRSNSGLYYVINEEGTGTSPNAASTVSVVYKGYYTDKKVFDQSSSQGSTFGLNQVIKGWTEGLQYFKEGGHGILLIPSSLGYGNKDYNGIPAGSVLIFDVNLIQVK